MEQSTFFPAHHSGNEDLIDAMRRNTMLWHVTWQLSARGGLYIFRYPRNEALP